jgi:hypothetical protein
MTVLTASWLPLRRNGVSDPHDTGMAAVTLLFILHDEGVLDL